jgi:ParB/RepB/Spo0J family partition protein
MPKRPEQDDLAKLAELAETGDVDDDDDEADATQPAPAEEIVPKEDEEKPDPGWPIEEIEVASISTEFPNIRQNTGSEHALAALADDIAKTGLSHPLRVIAAETGHMLIEGHRRLAAVKRLGWKKVKATIIPPATTAKELHFMNAAENIKREQLTDYELAAHASFMLETFPEMARDEYAQRIGKSLSYITNLVRYYRGLPSDILDDWKQQHPLLSQNLMRKYVLMEEEEAVTAWHAYCGLIPLPGPNQGLNKLGAAARLGKASPRWRASERALIKLRAAIELARPDLGKEAYRVALNVAKFALGEIKQVPEIPLTIAQGRRHWKATPRAAEIRKKLADELSKKTLQKRLRSLKKTRHEAADLRREQTKEARDLRAQKIRRESVRR